jgi:vitamin B12 transporter
MKAVKCIMMVMLAVMPAMGLFAEDGADISEPGTQEAKKDVYQLGEIVVTATKTSINKRETGASITVITGEEMEKKGNRMVIEALKSAPGLTVTQQGVTGGISSVFMRGAAPRNLLVLVDGVRVNDPTSPDGAYNFSDLTADNIERVEIIRGAQSTLYGTDATAGIVNIITKKGYGKNTLTLSAEGGTFMTFREYAGFHGGDTKANYSFSLSRTDSGGISQADKASGAVNEPEKDGYENTTATANVGGVVSANTSLSMALRYGDAITDIDDWAYLDDPNHTQRNRQMTAAVTMDQDVTDWWRHKVVGNYMGILRNTIDKADAVDPGYSQTYYLGTQRQLEWRHVLKYGNIDELTAGVEYQDEAMSSLNDYSGASSSFGEERMYSIASYLQNHLKLFDRFFIIAGLRLTDHEIFGTHWDYQLSGSAIIPITETRLKGNYATGFKAPTLYQLNVDDGFAKGSMDLKPEESRSFDFGIEQPFLSGKMVVEGSFFRSKYSNLITTMGFPMVYVNKQDAETEGYEGALTLTPFQELRITGAYTYLKEAKEEGTEGRLIRRPKHQGSLFLNLVMFTRININAGIIYAGERDDFKSGNRVTMDDYLLFNAAVSVTLMEKFQVFARCENITDEHYQDVLGYKRPGRAFYGGIKGTF